jgi:hypothetical protein
MISRSSPDFARTIDHRRADAPGIPSPGKRFAGELEAGKAKRRRVAPPPQKCI